MSVTVRIPGPLRPFADGRSRVALEGPTNVDEAIRALPAGVRTRVLDEQGVVRPHVNVFVGPVSIRETGGLATPVADGAELFLIPAVSGGAAGPLHRFFAADHERLDALLKRSLADPARVDLVPFGAFRAGILRHIGMEEKVLFPLARRARGGEPLPIAARLRVDHGAIAALLVPTPTPAIVALLVSLLEAHNRREEDPGGVYEACDQALDAKAAEGLVEALREFPEPPLKPYNDGPEVMKHLESNLELARRQWLEAEVRGPSKG